MIAHLLYIVGGIILVYWGYIWFGNYNGDKDVVWAKLLISVILLIIGVLMIGSSIVHMLFQQQKGNRF